MKSRTSSCKTAFGKDLSRFWPVWAGYTLALYLLHLGIKNSNSYTYWYANNMAEFIGYSGLVNCAFALVSAQMLFGDLFNSRMCNGLHTLPLKREEWFAAHVKAGFLFSLIPTALLAVFSECQMLIHADPIGMVNGWQIPLYWWVGVNLQYIFFFGLAALCVMCAGNRLGMAALYGSVNFGSLLALLMADRLYTPRLFGVITQMEVFSMLCPAYHLGTRVFLLTDRVKTGNTYLDDQGVEQQEYVGQFTVPGKPWIYLAVLVVLGIGFLLLARYLYKKRHLEKAGDLLAVKGLEPVFQVVFSLLCAAGFYALFYVFGTVSDVNAWPILGIGLVVGWFAARMFLEHSTRVFRPRSFIGLALVAAAFGGSLYLTSLDPAGIADWVPEAEDVVHAQLTISHNVSIITEENAEIEELIRIHEDALEQRFTPHPDYSDSFNYTDPGENPPASYIRLNYRMKNGWNVSREYHVLVESEGGNLLKELGGTLPATLNNEHIQTREDLRHAMKQVQNVHVGGYDIDKELLTEDFLMELADAIAADCENRTLIQSTPFHPEPIFRSPDGIAHQTGFYLDLNNRKDFYVDLTIYADSTNTLAVLESTGVLDTLRAELQREYK